jgi:hypothetical protein
MGGSRLRGDDRERHPRGAVRDRGHLRRRCSDRVGTEASKPEVMDIYLDSLAEWGLRAVGWAWCDAEDAYGARAEATRTRRSHMTSGSTTSSPTWRRSTTRTGTRRPSSSTCRVTTARPSARSSLDRVRGHVHPALRLQPAGDERCRRRLDAAGVLARPGATVAASCEHARAWGWPADRVRPLCQVYETDNHVPESGPYLAESAQYGVGLVPYILEQALSGQGRKLLTEPSRRSCARP